MKLKDLLELPFSPHLSAVWVCVISNFFTIMDVLMLAGFSLNAGLPYHGKTSDVWAVGVTLYCLTVGQYPFLGDNLHETYDKVIVFCL